MKLLKVFRAHPDSEYGRRWKERAIAVDTHGVLVFVALVANGKPLAVDNHEDFDTLYAGAAKACGASDCKTPAGEAKSCEWGWECQAWRDTRSEKPAPVVRKSALFELRERIAAERNAGVQEVPRG